MLEKTCVQSERLSREGVWAGRCRREELRKGLFFQEEGTGQRQPEGMCWDRPETPNGLVCQEWATPGQDVAGSKDRPPEADHEEFGGHTEECRPHLMGTASA